MSKTDRIVQLAALKHQATRQRVVQVLADWPPERAMTFAAVGRAARVSKTFLYAPPQADLAAAIRARQVLLRPTGAPARRDGGKSPDAKDAQIARLQERVRQQEQEMARLRTENAAFYGRLATCT